MEVNLTPMIDCTFQLIIFFIIVAQISNEELAPLIVPEPDKSRAKKQDLEQQGSPDVTIVNVWSEFEDRKELDDGTTRDEEPILAMKAVGYKVRQETLDVGDLRRLTEILREERAGFESNGRPAQTYYVEVRADMDVGYDQVLPVMRAAAEAGIARMYMTAVADPNYRAVASIR
jgi:biopolymer transport protein ExbD